MKPQEKAFMVVGTAAVMAVSGIVGYTLFVPQDASSKTPSTTVATTSATAASTPTATQAQATNSSSYKDGTYQGTASYRVPHGSNSISVSVTVKDGKVVSASATHDYSDRESAEYVDSFDSSLSSEVNNQSLDSLSVFRIGGASLTTEAFSSALDTIRSEAAA